MAAITCIFNDVNKENTGVWVREKRSESSNKVGLIIKQYYKSFAVDSDSGDKDGWYRLIGPSKYNITKDPCYVKLKASYLKEPSAKKISEMNAKFAKEEIKVMSTSNSTPQQSTTTLTVENNSNYTSGLDNKIYDMLNKEFDIASFNNNARIMGTPFKFLKSADYRPLSNSTLGRQYIENILAEAPIVHLVPGIPSYMPGINKNEQEAIDNFISARYNNQDISEDALTNILKEEGRYFEFQSAYAQYIQYANLLCRICAIYMGIDKRIVPGTDETYGKFDWGKWTNINYSTEKKQSTDGMWDPASAAASTVFNELLGDYKYIKCYVEPNTSFSESTSNSTGQSQIAGLFDTMEGIMREVGFFSNGTGLLDNVVNLGQGVGENLTSAVQSALSNGAGNGLSKIMGSANNVLQGSNVIFPELWTDSSTSKGYSFSINLVSPYGDIESIYLNIIMPMMHFIALAMPRQTSANSFGSPFLIKMFSKGHISCDMGIISNITIDKGGGGDAWSVHGLPLEAKISVTINDLYTNTMITKSSQPALFFRNQGLIDFLAVTCGIDVTLPNFAMKIQTIVSTFKESVYDIPSNIYDNIIQGMRNQIERYFKITNY